MLLKMKHLFTKSGALMLFASAVSFVLVFGTSLIRSLTGRGETEDISLFLLVTALLTALLLLNATDVVGFWLRGKTQELRVKHILGIPRRRIYASLYADLNLLLFLSFPIGVLLAALCAALFSPLTEVSLTLSGCLLALIFDALFLNLFCMALTKLKLRREFTEN